VPTAQSWPEGRASIGAISLAIDMVNTEAQASLLGPMIRGRNITYSWKEVACDRSKALAALSQILEEGPVDAVIGPDCSAACESTAILTSARELPQISYSCSSSALSDKTTYPTVRLAPGSRVRVTETVCTLLTARPYL
jgi:guanylate cyclase